MTWDGPAGWVALGLLFSVSAVIGGWYVAAYVTGDNGLLRGMRRWGAVATVVLLALLGVIALLD